MEIATLFTASSSNSKISQAYRCNTELRNHASFLIKMLFFKQKEYIS